MTTLAEFYAGAGMAFVYNIKTKYTITHVSERTPPEMSFNEDPFCAGLRSLARDQLMKEYSFTFREVLFWVALNDDNMYVIQYGVNPLDTRIIHDMSLLLDYLKLRVKDAELRGARDDIRQI